MKWLVDTMGWDELQARILKERRFLLASSTWPGGIPEVVQKLGDSPAGAARRRSRRRRWARARPCRSGATTPYQRWDDANVVRGAAKGTVSAYAYCRLGDVTSRPVPGAGRHPARARRRGAGHQPPERRVPGPDRGRSCPRCSTGSTPIGMAEPGAELARDVVACPGADTCNLAVTQCRGLADAIGAAPRGGGPGRRRRRAHQHLRLHQLVRPAPHLRHRVLRRRAPGPRQGRPRLPDAARRLRRPGADPLRREGAAAAGQERARGGRAGRAPLRRRARRRARRSAAGWTASAAPRPLAEDLRDLDEFPTPEDGPEYYVDYGETGPYVAETGESECAT